MSKHPQELDSDAQSGVKENTPLADTGCINPKFLVNSYAPISSVQKGDIYLPDKGNGSIPVILSVHSCAFSAIIIHDSQVLLMHDS